MYKYRDKKGGMNVNCMIISVITAATEILTIIVEGNLTAITRKHSLKKKKTAVPGTSDRTRQVLKSET